MNVVAYLHFLLALLFVLGLIGGAAWLARRFGLGHAVRPLGGNRRLAIVETLALDGKRRLVLLRRDGVEHLIVLGPSAETVVERGIGTATATAGNGFAAALRAQQEIACEPSGDAR